MQKQAETETQTIVIDDFSGRLTRYPFGAMNSGFAKYPNSFGYNPFTTPKVLQWFEQPVQIDPAGAIITDLILDGKQRVESGITYVYAIGHTGRLYKIQVNDPASFNPNYDTPILLTTLTSNTPTFKYGGYMDFYGSTERIFIGHDIGVTRVDFDGTNETFVGSAGSYTANVPRNLRQFLGSLMFGNGNNLGLIDTTNTVATYAKLSLSFPLNTQVRDLDVSPDGVYLEAVVSSVALGDQTVSTPDTSATADAPSYIFKWNGADSGYTSFDTFPAFSLTSNITFGLKQFTFGYDLAGTGVYNPLDKILSPTFSPPPLPNATTATGNLVGWFAPSFSLIDGSLQASQYLFGALDREYTDSWYCQLKARAIDVQTDVVRVPFTTLVSNFAFGTVYDGYPGGVYGYGKQYFSTLETNALGQDAYRFYSFFPVPTGVLAPQLAIYETQTQLFSKKVNCPEIRIYTNPLVTGNGFIISLIGPDGNVIDGSEQGFQVGINVNIGDDRILYNPGTAPSYGMGIRIQNGDGGNVNMQFNKVEVDYSTAGK